MPSRPLFTIYEGGVFKNRDRLNDVGKLIYGFFEYCKTRGVEHEFQQVTAIYIYSLQRNNSPSHRANKAVDFAVVPLYMNVWFYNRIHEHFSVNIYLSAHNKHIHVDTFFDREGGRWINNKKIEFLDNQEKTKLANPRLDFFTDVPINFRNNFNMSIIDQYSLPYAADFRSSGAWTLAIPGDRIKSIMFRSRRNFETVVPENSKTPLANPRPWWLEVIQRILHTITPGVPTPEPYPGQQEIPWNLILLTFGGLGVLSILSENNTQGLKVKKIEFE